MNMRLPIMAKVILYQVLFLVIHYLYDWFPGSLTYFFSATNESVFQHMKAGFYTYLALTTIEFGLANQVISSKSRYFYARLFGASILPFLLLAYFLSGRLYLSKSRVSRWKFYLPTSRWLQHRAAPFCWKACSKSRNFQLD